MIWFRGNCMKFWTMPVIALCFAVSVTSAKAFQETTIGGGAPATPEATQGAAAPANAAANADLSLMTPEQKKAADAKTDSGGFSIPGFGRLGLLPKMNFGLELLYGQGEEREAVTKPQEAPLDEFTIRGSVKHNF